MRLMDKDALVRAIAEGNIEWSVHALRRMLQRSITRAEVQQIISTGEIIEGYPDDKPLPGALISGASQSRPLHVVVAFDGDFEFVSVITAYQPDAVHFEDDFRTRRKS